MPDRIHLICAESKNKCYTQCYKKLDRNPANRIIKDRCKDIYDYNAADSEHKVLPRRYGHPDSKNIRCSSTISVPRSFSPEIRGPILYHAAQYDCRSKLCKRMFPKSVQHNENQDTAAPINRQPRPVQHAPVLKSPDTIR